MAATVLRAFCVAVGGAQHMGLEDFLRLANEEGRLDWRFKRVLVSTVAHENPPAGTLQVECDCGVIHGTILASHIKPPALPVADTDSAPWSRERFLVGAPLSDNTGPSEILATPAGNSSDSAAGSAAARFPIRDCTAAGGEVFGGTSGPPPPTSDDILSRTRKPPYSSLPYPSLLLWPR